MVANGLDREGCIRCDRCCAVAFAPKAYSQPRNDELAESVRRVVAFGDLPMELNRPPSRAPKDLPMRAGG